MRDQTQAFELTSGELCLDFANTIDSRPTENPRDRLHDYGTLVDWGRLAGTLEKADAKALREEATRRPKKAEKTLKRARRLREAVFDIFSAVAHQTALPDGSLDLLNKHLQKAVRIPRLAVEGSSFELSWQDEPSLDRMLQPVVRSAMTLLTSEILDRVRVCSAGDCDWLFVDLSRNRSRRWCDMSVCGNRSKVKRFRQSQRKS